jgi:hypothetical protein
MQIFVKTLTGKTVSLLYFGTFLMKVCKTDAFSSFVDYPRGRIF